VTSVLRTLPSNTRRRVPFRIRHRAAAVAFGLLVLVCAASGAFWLATRAHSGTGKLAGPSGAPKLVQVQLCQTCAHDYNPDGLGGDRTQNPQEAGLAIDNDPNTAWQTEEYYDGTLGKPGVGLYVDAYPGVDASKILILTATPGFSVQIWAQSSKPDAHAFDGAWIKLARVASVQSRQWISLSTGAVRYRYYLVWITKLPPGGQSASLNEVALYRYA